ncbi:hypothetical protein BGZ83_003228 [Gryganskiella cystojenkinii]|nr:hypothetical protein BGZ83_003228 [Gryganskiella cystojenkinii]
MTHRSPFLQLQMAYQMLIAQIYPPALVTAITSTFLMAPALVKAISHAIAMTYNIGHIGAHSILKMLRHKRRSDHVLASLGIQYTPGQRDHGNREGRSSTTCTPAPPFILVRIYCHSCNKAGLRKSA